MMHEQRTTPEQRAELWRRYEAALADIEATWPWQHALTIAAPALLSDADALTGALKETARLRAVLEEIIDLPTTPVSGLGGVDKSIIGMAVKAGRLEAAAIAARALTPGVAGGE